MSPVSAVRFVLFFLLGLMCTAPLVAQIVYWEEIAIPTDDDILQIVGVPNQGSALLGDQRVWWTSIDGVGIWDELAFADSVGPVQNLAYAPTYFVALGSEVLRTVGFAGGWDVVLGSEVAEEPLYAFCSFPGGRSFCSDGVSIYASDDNNQTFTKLDPQESQAFPTMTIEMQSLARGLGYAAGSSLGAETGSAAISRSQDSGKTWEAVWVDPRSTHTSVLTTVDSKEAYDVCAGGSQVELNENDPRGLILYSRDGGESWTESETVFDHPIVDISFANFGHVYCLDTENDIYWSTNGGQAWVLLEVPTQGRSLSCIAVSHEGELYIGGADGYLARILIPTSVLAEQLAASSSVYPNPSDGSFDVNTPHGVLATVTLYTLSGEVVKRTTTDAGSTIFDVSDVAAGAYLIVVSTRCATSTTPIVVQ